MISSLTQMTMDAHLYRIFTQSKLHVHAAHKPVMLPNNKDQCPFAITPPLIKMFLSSPLHYSHFFLFTHFRTILFFSFFPSFASSLCLYFIFIFFFLFFLVSLFIPLLTTTYSFFSSPFIFYCFACILFFLSYYFFTLLCICARLNSTSLVCGMWKS